MYDEALLLSIQPRYANRILDGNKTVELRKIKPRLRPGSTIYVYVSSPVKALVATCVAEKVISGTPEEIWPQVSSASGLTKEEFDKYFAGSAMAYGIHFHELARFEKPVGLNLLRRLWTNFHPPQSYHYLNLAKRNKISLQLESGAIS